MKEKGRKRKGGRGKGKGNEKEKKKKEKLKGRKGGGEAARRLQALAVIPEDPGSIRETIWRPVALFRTLPALHTYQ